MRTASLILMTLLFSVPALAQRQPAVPANPLNGVREFQCTFSNFGVARWGDEGATVVAGEEDFNFAVAAVDLRRSRARIVGATASADATAMLTPTGLNVIEQTPSGNFLLTTIFAVARSTDTYYAVHSRHLGDQTTPPSASQYYGTCEVDR